MEEVKDCALDPEVLSGVTGGQTTDPDAGNWQAIGAEMGTAFIYRGMLWHRLKYGETLGQLAGQYGTTVPQIRNWNPATTTGCVLQAGAAVVVKPQPSVEDLQTYPLYNG